MEEAFSNLKVEQNAGDDKMSKKRQDYLPWEDYFLAVAFLSAMRSKDPSTQVSNFENAFLNINRFL